MQIRIEKLLDKQKIAALSAEEDDERDCYEEKDNQSQKIHPFAIPLAHDLYCALICNSSNITESAVSVVLHLLKPAITAAYTSA